MSLPVTIPFTFGNATTTQSLSSLDNNFTTIKNAINGLTNGASQINVSSITATGTANSITFLRGDGAWSLINVASLTAVGTANATTYLRGDGTWGIPPGTGSGTGTVTSIDVNGGTTGLTTSGGPIVSSGNITISGTLVPANGGTGLTNITSNNVILGNGTGSIQVVAPGSTGNVLTSNGTTWVSQASSTSTIGVFGGIGSYVNGRFTGATGSPPGTTVSGSDIYCFYTNNPTTVNPPGTYMFCGAGTYSVFYNLFQRIS